MLKSFILLTLPSLYLANTNSRLDYVFNKMRRNLFHPAVVGSVERLALEPYAYLRQQTSGDNPNSGAYGEPGNRGRHWHPQREGQHYDRPQRPHFNNTYFCPVPDMVQKDATLVQQSDYPWLARVIHAAKEGDGMTPLICTAVLIKHYMFLTAARCIATAKIDYTIVILDKSTLAPKAFILPSSPSKQMFDDVGLIAVYGGSLRETPSPVYPRPIKLVDKPRALGYDWFEDWALNTPDNYVVGFIASRESPESQQLYKLDKMYASNSVCNKIYPMVDNSSDYWAPCVHSCSVDEHRRRGAGCRRYLLGLGHAVVDKHGQLLGVVTWTCGNHEEDRLARGDIPLHLGISVPNKDTLDLDMKCAEIISYALIPKLNDTSDGYHHKLCNATYGFSLSNPYKIV